MATYLKFDKIYKYANLLSLMNLKQDEHTQKQCILFFIIHYKMLDTLQ